ncbi:cytochrome c [Poseidonocella pacifica]|uniref:Cytochrome c n=1 Tax=Poseidonocella pacifica TaxID=871651 RepID=A0A1I0YIR7_9RHOB|nr:cytochrome c family protein [Poseidonocella pacifica]SFB12390.1 cytochrome c [Poseidonocella pacifica]
MIARTLSALAILAAGVTGAAAQDAEFEITGDAAKGERVFRKCMACHAVGEDAKHKVGPILNGVLGRQAGTIEDFAYSDAMVEAGAEGLTWTPETLAEFLAKPRDYVKGTKMAFAGLRRENELTDVVAYLAQYE